jgi:hypothetical protein
VVLALNRDERSESGRGARETRSGLTAKEGLIYPLCLMHD